MQELGLQVAYSTDPGTYSLLRKVMALPFLPEDEIAPMFEQLQRNATSEPLQRFMEYVNSTWICSSTWPPSSWCVYLQSVKTNNDVEGWHNGLNRRAHGKSQLPFYLLVQLLHQEARLASLQIRLVSEKKLRRLQKKSYRKMQAKIFNLWDEYQQQKMTAKQLLRACAHLYGPVEV